MSRRFVTLDVFTQTPLTGNPLAVVVDCDHLTDQRMQAIGREFNLSETTFVFPPADPKNTAEVRIFTPECELPFAGHPTIGTAIILAMREHEGEEEFTTEVRLEEKVGLVPVTVTVKPGEAPHGVFSSPVMPRAAGDPPSDELIADALGLVSSDIGFDAHLPGIFNAGLNFLFVPVHDLAALKRASVVMPGWHNMLEGLNVHSAYIYTKGGDSGVDFQSRLFAPDEGILEDPATGSAAATFPGQILVNELLGDGDYHWKIAQGIEIGRPSRIDVEARIRDGIFEYIRVGGHARIVQRGTIHV